LAYETASRLEKKSTYPEGEPLLDSIDLKPRYVNARLDMDGRGKLEAHVAEAACGKKDGSLHVGLLSPAESWEGQTAEILVEAEVLGREDRDSGLVEAEENQALLREFLARSEHPQDVLERCCEQPCALLAEPDFGVRAVWATHFGGDPAGVNFKVGSGFVASLRGLDYDRRAGDARRCLRIMAMIAGGRASEVEGHEHHEGPGTASAVLQVGGRPVIRSYLSNHVANAHRLFWIRGEDERPTFLNVSGHDGKPAI
jgi:hypothetical protein